ncbi:MAG: metal ABC transporter permease [Phycisphaerales bacterium]|nr:metal ABC transporter permease [Phycisphaerales bacterium]
MEESFLDLLLLRDWNLRMAAMCTALLGAACGMVGTLMLLRKRALAADAMSHATLPGVVCAFLMAPALGSAKSLGVLLVGGAVTAIGSALCITWIRRFPHVKEDTATGVVLGGFFGLGLALLGVAQSMPSGAQAGLTSFIYGKAASLTQQDLRWITAGALASCIICVLLFKELRLLCFDESFAASIGRRTKLLDALLMGLVGAVVVIGLQAVGAVLVLALLILPGAAARQIGGSLSRVMLMAALTGALSGWLGCVASAAAPRLPAGAIIVLVAATMFACIAVVAGMCRARGRRTVLP